MPERTFSSGGRWERWQRRRRGLLDPSLCYVLCSHPKRRRKQRFCTKTRLGRLLGPKQIPLAKVTLYSQERGKEEIWMQQQKQRQVSICPLPLPPFLLFTLFSCDDDRTGIEGEKGRKISDHSRITKEERKRKGKKKWKKNGVSASPARMTFLLFHLPFPSHYCIKETWLRKRKFIFLPFPHFIIIMPLLRVRIGGEGGEGGVRSVSFLLLWQLTPCLLLLSSSDETWHLVRGRECVWGNVRTIPHTK